MELKAYQIKCAGDIVNERIIFVAGADLNAFDYGIGRAPGDREEFYSILSFFYMLPKIMMIKGDMLSVYTKPGVPDSFIVDKNRRVHRIYMGFSEPVWREGENVIISKVTEHSMKVAQDIIVN